MAECAKDLQKRLGLDRKNATVLLDADKIKEAYDFNCGYKKFLDNSKTERACVDYTIDILKENAFTEYNNKNQYNAGDKVYINNRNKSLIMAVIGTDSLENGVSILASHIDSPRLDLKPNPLYEQGQIALFKTHYYGGIKKYQWTALPLSLQGVIVKEDGSTVKVNIGEDDNDPVFCITDLLPHLAGEQSKRTLNEGIKGEELNVLVGSECYNDDDIVEKVKLNVLRLLNEKYDITEKDFLSAELSLVPTLKARDVGFDRGLIGAYGQDDRVCAYTSLIAMLEVANPKTTIVNVFGDKEEIGSDGNTGLKSAILRYFIADLGKPHNIEGRDILSKSKCLSADVNVAFDPTFPEVTEKNNTAYINYGVCLTKYTGARGKSGSSDASAELMGYVRNIFDKNDVIWQTGELGKVDQGGGGTVAAYIANLNVDVVDVGVPVLSMHAPFEITSKIDVFMTYKGFLSFCER